MNEGKSLKLLITLAWVGICTTAALTTHFQ
jgi:hypothetical protein